MRFISVNSIIIQFNFFFRHRRLSSISFTVKIKEENENESILWEHEERKEFWKSAIIGETQKEPVNRHQTKLNLNESKKSKKLFLKKFSHHLQDCDVFFKETLLVFAINRGEVVIEVHNHVYERVYQTRENRVTTREVFGAAPCQCNHSSMLKKLNYKS